MNRTNAPYYRFSDYLIRKYGQKVYKLPVHISCSCPNRDGTIGTKGCIFCGEQGADYEMLPVSMTVSEQLAMNRRNIGEKYGAKKFIAYFQNYSNTYLPYDQFASYVNEAVSQRVVAIYVSTRPDCMDDNKLQFLQSVQRQSGVDVVMELGLQSINEDTLVALQRGHTVSDFVDAVFACKAYELEVCAHVILDLPWDTQSDVKRMAGSLSAWGIDQVKGHTLYVQKNTPLANAYLKGHFKPLCFDTYLQRAVAFLCRLDSRIAVQRLVSRAPKEETLFINWGMSSRKVVNLLEAHMRENGLEQGCLC